MKILSDIQDIKLLKIHFYSNNFTIVIKPFAAIEIIATHIYLTFIKEEKGV